MSSVSTVDTYLRPWYVGWTDEGSIAMLIPHWYSDADKRLTAMDSMDIITSRRKYEDMLWVRYKNVRYKRYGNYDKLRKVERWERKWKEGPGRGGFVWS